jgi:hypothetical protein
LGTTVLSGLVEDKSSFSSTAQTRQINVSPNPPILAKLSTFHNFHTILNNIGCKIVLEQM